MREKTFIIAELSANHNGSLEVAVESIRAAKRTGADAIKLQTYTADTITINSKKDDFKIKGTIWEDKYLYDLYQEAYTPWEWHAELFRVAKEEGLVCFSSPFDKTAVDFLESLDSPIYKIASFEITDIPLIEYAASKGKPMILSTGIAEYDDIKLAVDACRKMGNNDITLLKCTSSYPAPIEEANMVMIPQFAKDFNVKVGLSDHTLGSTVPVVATCFGANVIEKHFIMDRDIGGPDASFSMNEEEFTAMVKAVREAEKAIGTVDYTLTPKQAKGKDFSRSLYVVENIKEGEAITEDNVRSIRPGFGLHPKYYNEVMGKKVNRNMEKGERLSLVDLSSMVNNIFIVNTPFQHYISEMLIQRKFPDRTRYINTIVSTNPNIARNKNIATSIYISRGFSAIKDLRRVRSFLLQIKSENKEVSFFIPHLNNLLSSYVYTNLIAENARVSVYYEGIALFYDPVVKTSNLKKIQRSILGYLSGMKYKHYDTLFPTELRKTATAFTPTSEFCTGFENIEPFDLPTIEIKTNKKRILLLLPPCNTEQEHADVKYIINSIAISAPDLPIFLKPHFTTKSEVISDLIEYGCSKNISFCVLEKSVAVEQQIVPNEIGIIYMSYFSSALINLRLMYCDQLVINLMCRSIPSWYVETSLTGINITLL